MEDIIERLKQWSEKNRLIDMAIESCKVSLANSADEDREIGEVPLKGWLIEDIKLLFARQALIFNHRILSHPFIETQIGLYVDDQEKLHYEYLRPIGTYRLITTLSGQVEDDYLELEKSDT